MGTTTTISETPPSSAAQFATTHWSVVLAAGGKNEAQSLAALETLCRAYWYPLYAYVRRRGFSPEDAQDLTQEFFAHLLAHDWVSDADRARGRFRTFLLTAMSRFLANEWDRSRTQKRGGNHVQVPLDTALAEHRYQTEPATATAPDQLYDRHWAMTLLDQALSRLSAEQEQAGKAAEFALMSFTLTAERGDIPYAKLASQLGLSEPATRMAVHRLRQRFRAMFREEIGQTVATPEEVQEEIRHLLAVLAG